MAAVALPARRQRSGVSLGLGIATLWLSVVVALPLAAVVVKSFGSWDAIFANTDYIQFVLTDAHVTVAGDAAWVTLDENILQAEGDAELWGARATATNVFVRADVPGVARWLVVVHHASPVAADG